VRDFAAGFLQIPPHGGHPCLELTVPTTKPVRDFHPIAIAHVGRTNKRSDVVRRVGENEIKRLLELADILHCEPVEKSADDLIDRCKINDGGFDNLASCKFSIPTHFDIAKVYKRLIMDVSDSQNLSLEKALVEIYTSWISEKIDDYNSSMYFENPQYLYESYVAGEPI